MAKIKVIHLELEGNHYYFGSPKAMFDVFGKEELGMTYSSFHSNVHLKFGEPYVNARKGYTIRVGYLTQTKTNRNNNLGRFYRREENAAPTDVNPFAGEPINETVASAPVAEPAAKPTAATDTTTHQKRKKKDKDVPEQLTLF